MQPTLWLLLLWLLLLYIWARRTDRRRKISPGFLTAGKKNHALNGSVTQVGRRQQQLGAAGGENVVKMFFFKVPAWKCR